MDKRTDAVASAGRPAGAECALCGRFFPHFVEATVGGMPLCHPDSGQDCYRLVTVYGRAVADGRRWGGDRWYGPSRDDVPPIHVLTRWLDPAGEHAAGHQA